MEKSELIDLIKVSAVNVMKEKKILASIIIAESIRILYTDNMITCYSDLVMGNNPMAVEADKDYEGETIFNEKTKTLYRTYPSLEEGISNYITLNEKKKFNRIKEVYDYKEALSKLSAKFYDTKELETYIEAYRLYELDNTQLKEMYSGSKNVIESTKKNTTTEMLKSLVNTHEGPGIGKTKAEVEKEKIKKERKAEEEKLNSRIQKPLSAGTKLSLRMVNLYKSIESNVPMRAISGIYYLMDGQCKYDRYALVLKEEYIYKPEFVIGYIDSSDIKIVE